MTVNPKLAETLHCSHPPLKKSTLFFWYVKSYKFHVFMAVLSIVGAACMVLSFGKILRALIDTGSPLEDAFVTVKETSSNLEFSLFIVFCFVAILSVFSFGRSYFVSWLSERMTTSLRRDLFKHMLSLEISYFDQNHSSHLVSCLTTDSNLIQVLLSSVLPIGLRNGLLLGGSLFMMLLTSFKLTGLSFLLLPVILIPTVYMGRRVRILSKDAQEKVGSIATYVEETLLNIKTCFAFNVEPISLKAFEEISDAAFETAANRGYYRAILSSFVMTIAFAGICGVLYVGIHDVESGALSAGALSSFLFYALLAAVTAGSFSENYADFKRASGAADRLIDVMQIRPSAKPLPQKAKGATHLPARGTLAVHNINFSYPSFSNKEGQPELTLKRVAFSINPGESVAIVGPSGAGKTTLFSLLMRFYDPQQGSLYLDGIDYKDLTVEEVRKRIAMVPQDPALFSTTLIENITYGSPFASKAAITKAIEIARLEEVIEKLPKGMRTTVGPRGAHLSGGQRQRVAIARAILRDPVLLLLDEATSALDALNEEAIQKGLEYLTSTRSSLTIAHRLKTVLHSEKIIVLDKGMVTGVGSHADLCDSNPLYRKLATLQFFEPALDKGLGKGLGRGMDKGINRGLANS